MYNGDVPATDFIKVTILLQNVIVFFCEQERIRRYYEQSYQEITKELIRHGTKNDNDRQQATLWLSKYFAMQGRDAIHLESTTVALSRFFMLHPINTIDASYNCVNNVNNTNSITIDNDDFNRLIQMLNALTEAVARAQPISNTILSPQQPLSVTVPQPLVKPIATSSDISIKPHPTSENASDPVVKPKKKYTRGTISARNAALLFNVSQREIQNWDTGVRTPHGYPGRGNILTLKKFAMEYNSQKSIERAALGADRPASGGGVSDADFDKHAYEQWRGDDKDE
jgi:hypothetical protein